MGQEEHQVKGPYLTHLKIMKYLGAKEQTLNGNEHFKATA